MVKLFTLMTILALAIVASTEQTFLNEELAPSSDEELKNHWAVLVAGSKGYFNYRHHADVCHAYHLLKRQGIPEENIIVMAYNDVPWEYMNPFLGKLFNSLDGKDYYEGCNMDYTGVDVNVHNFLAILKGDEAQLNLSQDSNATRKVLKSNDQSKVFLSFHDHGAPGQLLFPDTILYADQLNETIKAMYDKKLYQEFIMFIEACESGSMFSDVDLESMNVWALTATNATHPSFGTYCYPHDKIQGEHMYTCLGDLFSVSWIEYLEANERKLRDLTLKQLYHDIKQRTQVKSQVQNFGEQDITNQVVETVFLQDPSMVNDTSKQEKKPSVYQRFFSYLKKGEKKELTDNQSANMFYFSHDASKFIQTLNSKHSEPISKVSSREIEMHHMYHKAMSTPGLKEKQRLMQMLTERAEVEQVFATFLNTSVENLEVCRDGSEAEACREEWIPKDFDCLRSLTETYKSNCGPLSHYANNFVKYFVRECEQPTMPIEEAHKRIQLACEKEQ